MFLLRRWKLLAGVVALLGFSAGASGCRSGSACHTCYPPGTDLGAPGTTILGRGEPIASSSSGHASRSSSSRAYQVASLGAPVAVTPKGGVSRPLWKLTRKSHGGPIQPLSATPCTTCTPGQPVVQPGQGSMPSQTATMLRPVPLGQPLPAQASEWSPVQRVSGEGPINLDPVLRPAVTLEPSQPPRYLATSQLGAEPPLAPIPATVPTRLTQPDAGQEEPLKGAPTNKGPGQADKNNKSKSTLPPPRIKSSGDKKSTTTTPHADIPAPLITNPPNAPREFQKHALSSYIIEPPDVLRIDGLPGLFDESLPIEGPHLVRPDGTIGLGTYGAVFVAGMTIDDAKNAIIQTILRRQAGEKSKFEFKDYWEGIRVDVAAYNSKFYYVIADGGGYGETVIRLPCTGNETVLDAISQIQGLPAVASKKRIWVARATPHDQQPMILPVDWCSIVQGGRGVTNYQVFPGDRIYVNSDCRIRIDSHLAKILSPIERLFGITLLGATTVNAINGNQGFLP